MDLEEVGVFTSGGLVKDKVRRSVHITIWLLKFQKIINDISLSIGFNGHLV